MTPQSESQSDSQLIAQYRDGYKAAASRRRFGIIFLWAGVIGLVFSLVIVVGAGLQRPAKETAYEAGQAAGVRSRQPLRIAFALGAIGMVLWSSGRLRAAKLDAAVNSSPSLTETDKLRLQS